MNSEPRYKGDYTGRQVEAARRVLVDVGQALGSFRDAIVVVGGWVPDLLLPNPETEHVGSIDVDLVLDAAKLADGRYAALLKLLLDTGRYDRGGKDFQLTTAVDLHDGEAPVTVVVEFLAPADVKLKKHRPKLVQDFRALRFDACAAALRRPESVEFEGAMISGATNTVHLQVASLPDFVVMKAHAVQGRDEPKDVYDICYCLDEYPNGIAVVAADWRARADDPLVRQAIEILREKFQTVDHFGPQQLAIFHDSTNQVLAVLLGFSGTTFRPFGVDTGRFVRNLSSLYQDRREVRARIGGGGGPRLRQVARGASPRRRSGSRHLTVRKLTHQTAPLAIPYSRF